MVLLKKKTKKKNTKKLKITKTNKKKTTHDENSIENCKFIKIERNIHAEMYYGSQKGQYAEVF